MMRTSSTSSTSLSALRSANRRLLWVLVLVGTGLFAGSILFIISRAH